MCSDDQVVVIVLRLCQIRRMSAWTVSNTPLPSMCGAEFLFYVKAHCSWGQSSEQEKWNVVQIWFTIALTVVVLHFALCAVHWFWQPLSSLWCEVCVLWRVKEQGLWVLDSETEPEQVAKQRLIRSVEHDYRQRMEEDRVKNPHGEHAEEIWEILESIPTSIYKGNLSSLHRK